MTALTTEIPMEEIVPSTPVTIPWAWTFGSALGFGVLTDLLIVGHQRGINSWLISSFLLLAWLIQVISKKGLRSIPWGHTLLFGLASASLGLNQAGPGDLPILFVWFSALGLFFAKCRNVLLDLEGESLDSFIPRIMGMSAGFENRPKLFRNDNKERKTSRELTLGLVIGIPLSLLVLLLLGSGDAVFQIQLNHTFASLEYLPEHLFWVSLISLSLLVTSIWFLSTRKSAEETGEQTAFKLPVLSSLVVFSLLGVTLICFLAFHAKTLLLDRESVEALTRMDFRTYIRKGFAELLLTCIFLGITLLVTTQNAVWKAEAKMVHKLGATGLALLTACLSLSCVLRLDSYVEFAGWTIVRLFNSFSLIAVWVCLMVLILRVWKPARLNKTFGEIFLASVMVFIAYGLIQPVPFIAERNTTAWAKNKNIELSYLVYLGRESLPYLLKPELESVNWGYLPENPEIKTQIDRLLENVTAPENSPKWFEWHPGQEVILKSAQILKRDIK